MKINAMLFCFVFYFFTSLFTTAKAQVNTTDSLALVDLYNSTDGPNWIHHDNWLAGPVKKWYGIVVTNNRVTTVQLPANHLNGPLPSSIGNLTELQYLACYYDLITGTIPPSVGNCKKLIQLFFTGDRLTGTIPLSIGNLTQLKDLGLSGNMLSGSIPDTLGNLANLSELIIELNQLTGSIPDAICRLSKLTNFTADRNQLTGSLPDSLGNLISLTYLNVETNQLSGSIPLSTGKLVNLTDLLLDGNQLSGSIPDTLGNLKHLLNSNLSSNQLTGSIPAAIGNPQRLYELYLDHNQLSGAIPDLRHPGKLFLNNNQLSGSIPASLTKIPGFDDLDVSYNELSGEIPAAFLNLNNIGFINFSHNHLTQEQNVPYDFKKYGFTLDVSYNNFTFNGLESAVKRYTLLNYAPQAPIAVHKHNGALNVYAGGTLSKNTYTWFKTGDAGSTIITADSTYMPAQSGRYYAAVSNTIAKKLTLYTDTVSYTMPLQSNAAFLAENTAQIKSAESKLVVYPNPAKDMIHVQVNGNAIIVLTNSTGKILLTKTIKNSEAINVSSFANGVYYIQNKNTGETQKVIVVH